MGYFAFLLRWSALTAVHVPAFMIGAYFAGAISQPGSGSVTSVPTENPGDGGSVSGPMVMLALVLAVCVLHSFVLTLFVRCSKRHGFALLGSVALLFFACLTLMPQIEVVFFLPDPWPIVRLAGVMGIVVVSIVSVVAVLSSGRLRGVPARFASGPMFPVPEGKERATGDKGRWLVRLLSLAVLYVLLYLVCGYFIAWQSPELRLLYSRSEELFGFFEQMGTASIWSRLIPLQLVRGVLWTLLVLFAVRSLRCGRLAGALLVASSLAVLMNAQLLLPNPYMQESVRITHMIETAICNFLFGASAAWVLSGAARSWRSDPVAGR